MERSKGLDTLVKVASILTEQGYDKFVRIDFYGQKKDDYFEKNLNSIPIFKYKGILQPDTVITTLQNYDALIYPSHYDGEGCPGILVEALFAGIPIIASKWKYNGEFVHNGVNGFLCETYDADSYVNAIITLLVDDSLRSVMSRHSRKMSIFYTAANAAYQIHNYFDR